MTVLPWPDHLLTLREWDDLPEDTSRRYELVEGVMQVSPRPVFDHQRAVFRLCAALDSQLPATGEVLPEVEMVVFAADPPTIRVPDVVVVPSTLADTNPARYDAADVLLAVEIVSPGSGRTDRITKLADYADAGIADYWIIELETPATLTAFRLIDGEYEVVAQGSGPLELSEPASVAVDVGALLGRRSARPEA